MPFILPDGSVARFVFRPRDMYADGNPKPKVFEPEFHVAESRYETSVCGMNGTTHSRLSELGKTVRAPMTAIAAVEIAVVNVTEAGLSCEEAPGDFVEHGVIIGWGADKSRHISPQQELAVSPRTIHRPL